MSKNWNDYLDSNGLVVQKAGDGGDSLNRTCVRYFLLKDPDMNEMFKCLLALACKGVLSRSSIQDGAKFRRSPHPNKWYNECDRTSRDQLIPLLALVGINNFQFLLKAILKDHLTRGLLFAYNTRRNHVYKTLEDHLKYSTPDVEWNYSWKIPDLTGPDFWALYIRGFKTKLLYPLLYLFDIETLISSLTIRFNKDRDDVINHVVIVEYARVRMDTFVMKLARLITPRKLLQERLDTFFGRDLEPPINELYRELNK